jgi:hypothetical protein
MRLGLGIGLPSGGASGGPYAAFDQYVAVSSAADYEVVTGASRWINRAPGGASYDWVQTSAANQPTPAVDGLDFDNSNDYMRCAQIAVDLQAYIALSQHPNILIMHRVTLTDGDGSPPGFLTTSSYWSCAPTSGNGYLRSLMLTTGRLRRQLVGNDNASKASVDLVLPPGDLGPGTYTMAEHFHDGSLDTYFDGALADTSAFDFTPIFGGLNPFATANCTMGARLTSDVTANDPLSGRVLNFAYKKGAAAVPVFP